MSSKRPQTFCGKELRKGKNEKQLNNVKERIIARIEAQAKANAAAEAAVVFETAAVAEQKVGAKYNVDVVMAEKIRKKEKELEDSISAITNEIIE